MDPLPARLMPELGRREKFYAGPAWLQYLIDHFLRPGAKAQAGVTLSSLNSPSTIRSTGSSWGSSRTRKLLVLWGEDDEVTGSILRRADPDYFEPGYRGLEDRPWLPDKPREEWDNDLQAWVPVSPTTAGGGA